MSDAEKRILQNQIEIMWVLKRMLEKLAPDLVGRNGEIDRMRDDLVDATKESRALIAAG